MSKKNNEIQTENMSFEYRINEIKTIMDKLTNDNEISLKDSMELYKKAHEHITIAGKMLDEAEFEIKTLLESK